MFNSFILTVAIRYFRAKKTERFVSIISGFSLLGVTIGVAALIVVMSVMNGFHRELTKNIIGLNGDIAITPINSVIKNYDEIKGKILSTNSVTRLTPVVIGQALAIGRKSNGGALIRGIETADLKFKKEIIENIIIGSLSNFSHKNSIVLGSELAYNLGVTVGSEVKLISASALPTAFGSMPRAKDFEVVAIFSSGMYDYDSATILMLPETASKFLGLGDGINLIEVNIDTPDKAISVARKLMVSLVDQNLKIVSWQQNNAQFLSALAVERVAMFTILSLIILVAAFNIISTLFMLVKDKTKDIAILKTMGASRRQIMLIFMSNGMLVGFIGTICGVILGTGFSYNIDSIRKYLEQITGTKIFEAAIYFLYSLPSDVQLGDIMFVATISFSLCFLATIYPSYKAAKLNPVDALRYE